MAKRNKDKNRLRSFRSFTRLCASGKDYQGVIANTYDVRGWTVQEKAALFVPVVIMFDALQRAGWHEHTSDWDFQISINGWTSEGADCDVLEIEGIDLENGCACVDAQTNEDIWLVSGNLRVKLADVHTVDISY